MSEISESQLGELEVNLGLRAQDDLIFPAPLDLETTPPGKDKYDQDIIDGSVHDDVITIPGLEDDFIAELQDSIDPTDDESMEHILRDLEETMSVVATAEHKNERLGLITREVLDRGSITKRDIQEALEIHPALNAYIPDINAFSDSYTLVGLDAGLNALTTGQKSLGGGILAVVLAIIFKIVASIYRVVTSRKNMDAVNYSQAIRTPSELKAKLDKAGKEVAEILKKDKNPKETAERFAKYMNKQHPKWKFDPRQVHIAFDSAVIQIILMDKIGDHWTATQMAIGGKPVGAATPALLQGLMKEAPEQLATAYEKLNDALDRAIKDFNHTKDQKAEDYQVDWDKWNYSYLGSAGKPNTAIAGIGTAAKLFAVKVPETTTKPEVSDYMRSTIDCSGVAKLDEAVKKYTVEILRKKDEYTRLLAAIQTTNDPDLLASRSKIMRNISTQYTQMQGAVAGILATRERITALNKQLQESIQQYLQYHVNVIVKAQRMDKNARVDADTFENGVMKARNK